jgi:hypothetical protein
VASQAIGTWAQIPVGNLLSDLDAKFRPDLNPSFPGNPPWYGNGFIGIANAYSGAAINQATAEVWPFLAGGHTDYGGNDVFRLRLNQNVPIWERLRNPSGAIGNLVSWENIAEGSASGIFTDGRPRTTHTYNGVVYVPGIGPAVTNLIYAHPNLEGPQHAWAYRESTNDYVRLADYSSLGSVIAPYGGSCWDSARGVIWALGGGAYSMVKINPTTGVTTLHGTVDNHAKHGLQLKYDSANDLIYILSSSDSVGWKDYPSRMSVFDPATNLFHVLPVPTGALPSGVQVTGDAVGWDQDEGRLLLWAHAAGDRTQIGVLTRPSSGNLRATAWAASAIAISGSNSVTPTAPPAAGTFGRGDYISILGGFFVWNAVDQNPYFFKLKNI